MLLQKYDVYLFQYISAHFTIVFDVCSRAWMSCIDVHETEQGGILMSCRSLIYSSLNHFSVPLYTFMLQLIKGILTMKERVNLFKKMFVIAHTALLGKLRLTLIVKCLTWT